MRRTKQITSAVLTTAMVATMFAPVASAEESTLPRVSEETVTITVEAPTGIVARNWNESLQWQVFEEQMGIKFDLIGSYTNEQWDSRETLMFASDEMPDLLALGQSVMERNEVQKYAAEGYLLDWTPYLEYMPNVVALMEQYPEFKTMVEFEDGGIYGWPKINVSNVEPNCVPLYSFVRKEWCENLGLEYPKTIDELYNVLVAFKEQDANGNGDPNDEIPIVAVKGSYGLLYPIMWAYGVTDRNQVYHIYADEEGKVTIADTQENYKEFLRFIHKLYKEKLINQDMFVLESAELNEYVNADRAGIFGLGGYDVLAPHIKTSISPVGFTSEYNEEAVLCASSVVSSQFVYLANADLEEEKAIALAKWIDFICTDEGQLTMRNGFDGVTYDYNEVIPGYGIPDHMAKAEEYGYGTDTNAFREEKALASDMGTVYTSSYGTIYDMLANCEDPLADEVWEQTTLNALREMTIRENPDVKIVNAYPNVFYTDEEAAERASLKTDVENYLKTAYAQFISGEMDIDADWDKYVNELDKIGLSRLLEIEQAAYDRIYS